MAGKFMAMVWAVAGGVLLLGTLLLLGSNIMFAMMAAGLSIACLLVAGACLLKPSNRSLDRAAGSDDPASDNGPREDRRRWGPR